MTTYHTPPSGDSSDIPRHWCPRSETYFTGDKLVSAIQTGWEIEPIIHREEVGIGSGRRVIVLHFDLHHAGRWVHMPIIETPYINRFVTENNFHVVPFTTPEDAKQSTPTVS